MTRGDTAMKDAIVGGLHRALTRRVGKLLWACLLALPLLWGGAGYAQTGKDFWFDIPEVNRGHVSSTNEFRVYLHVTNTSNTTPATVNLELPAEAGFKSQQFTVPPSQKVRIPLTAPGNTSSTGTGAVANSLSLISTGTNHLFYHPFSDGSGSAGKDLFSNPSTTAERATFIENVLAWSESNMTVAKPYINRTKKGVHMYSNQPINSYIEIANGWNMDLIPLKGENGLGLEFYVPFQNTLWTSDSRYWGMWCPPYHSFNIVATTDNTKIKITVPRPIWLANPTLAPQPAGHRGRFLPAGTYEIWLNRGESSIITPYEKHENPAFGYHDKDQRGQPMAYQTGRSENSRLCGAHVEADKPVVVLTRDDCTKSHAGNPDYVVDQLVPLKKDDGSGGYESILGSEHVLVRGVTSAPWWDEWAYVVATEDNTTVHVSNHGSHTLNAGQQWSVQLNSPLDGSQGVSVRADGGKKIVVYHMSGVENSSYSQKAGAIIPPLPRADKCIGSTSVAFSRSKSKAERYTFYLNVVVWVNTTAPGLPPGVDINGIGGFELQQGSPTGFVPVTDPALVAVQNYLNNPANWKTFPAGGLATNWKWIQIDTDVIGGYDAFKVLAGGQAQSYRLINTKNVFQLAVLNGFPDKDAFYGYFSDFKEISVGAEGNGWAQNPHTGVWQWEKKTGSQIYVCRGSEGTYIKPSSTAPNLQYFWEPPDYLRDIPTPAPPNSPPKEPGVKQVYRPRESKTYTLTAYGLCALTPKAKIEVIVSPRVDPQVSGPSRLCGSGKVPLRVRNLSSATNYKVQMWDNTAVPPAWVDRHDGTVGQRDSLTHFEDVTEPAVTPPPFFTTYKYRFSARNGGCSSDWVEREVRVYKAIVKPAIFVNDGLPIDECAVEANFAAATKANPNSASYPNSPNWLFTWKLGDGRREVGTNLRAIPPTPPPAKYEFKNFTNQNKTLTHTLVISDENQVCRDSATFSHTVLPTPQVSIVLDPPKRCEGEHVQISSNHTGVVARKWELKEMPPSSAVLETSDEAIFNVSPKPAGTYEVVLTGKNIAGCAAVDKKNLILNPTAKGTLRLVTPPTPTNDCSPKQVEIAADITNMATLGEYSFEWRLQKDPADLAGQLLKEGTHVAAGTPIANLIATLENPSDQAVEQKIVLTVTTKEGCSQRFEIALTVPPALHLNLEDKVTACPSKDGMYKQTIKLKDGSLIPAKSQYEWAINSGSGWELLSLPPGTKELTDREFPNYSTTSTLTYQVRLRVTSLAGVGYGSCSKEAISEVTVFPRAEATFAGTYTKNGVPTNIVPDDPMCPPVDAHFVAGATALNFEWTFTNKGDNTTATEVGDQVDHKIENALDHEIDYEVKLRAFNTYGCTDSHTETYKVRRALKAAFAVEMLHACNPVVVKIESQCQPPESTPGITATWDYGGGVRDPGFMDRYIYSAPGHKTIKLSITDGVCTSEAPNYTFEVPDVIKARMGPIVDAEKMVCAPATINFKDRSTGASYVEWAFYQIQPVLTPLVQTLVRTIPGSTTAHTFANDGGTASKTFRAVLRAGNTNSVCVDTAFVDIKVFPTVLASSAVVPTSNCTPIAVSMTNASTAPVPGSPATYTWEFTPDNQSYGQPVTVKSNTPGPQTATLTNTSQNEDVVYKVSFVAEVFWENTKKCSVKVEDLLPVKVPPVLDQQIQPDRDLFLCSGGTLRFKDGSRGGELLHEWDFGDGTQVETSGRGEAKEHVFENAGAADVVRNVKITTRQTTVPSGCQKVKTIPVTVHAAAKANFTIELPPANCTQPYTVRFENNSRGDVTPPPGVTSSYVWDPDDGAPAETRNDMSAYTHDYKSEHLNQPQTFHPKLTMEQKHENSGLTCKGKAEGELTISPDLKIGERGIEVSVEKDCAPFKSKFRAQGTGGANLVYKWDFGDGESGEGNDVEHEFKNLTETKIDRTVTLTLTNEYGCTLTAQKVITVYPQPIARFDLKFDSVCTPYNVEVTNKSQGNVDLKWFRNNEELDPSLTSANPFTLVADNTDPNSAHPLQLRLEALTKYPEMQNSPGCKSKYERSITVLPRLDIKFKVTPEEGCNPVTAEFRNESTGGGSYSWDFGGVGSADVANPSPVVFNNPSKQNDRVYTIKLTATNANGCRREAVQKITVYPQVEAKFKILQGGPTGVSVASICSPAPVYMKNESPSPAYSYTWQLGPKGDQTGVDADLTGPNDAYINESDPPAPMVIPIRLRAYITAHPECRAEETKNLTVYPKVLAEFRLPPDGCDPLVGEVKNLTKSYGATSYRWTLPDGQVITQEQPTLTLRNPSPYTELPVEVQLEARTEHGCVGLQRKSAVVWPTPRPAFEFKGGNMACPPSAITMENRSKGYALTYEWDFGDGIVTSTKDSVGIEHQFVNDSPGIKSYGVRLTTTSKKGCKASVTQQLFIYPQVKVDFTVSPRMSGCSPFDVSMAVQSQNAQYYHWSFGDGGTSSHESPTYRFVNNTIRDVEYDVRLTARSQYGCEATQVHRVTVWPRPGAAFTLTPGSQTFPSATISLVNQSAPASDDWTYTWKFGDGSTSTLREPGIHEYSTWAPPSANFTYEVMLKIEAPHCADSVVRHAIVRAPEPKTMFTFNQGSGCPPLKVQFYNKSLYGSSYRWDFGDGTSSISPEPEHEFTESRRYYVRLTTVGDGGESFSYQQIEVYPKPVVKFQPVPSRPVLPNAKVDMKNLTELGSTYLWDFGDGTQSTEEAPQHLYTEPGSFTVSLVAESEHGCVDSLSVKDAVQVLGAGSIRFPNVFHPRLDGPTGGYYQLPDQTNEVFHPYVSGSVQEYRLYIFNRWGEQIFESNELNRGWDGYRNGEPCPQGVYAWRAEGSYYDGTAFDMRGDVTLLR